MIKVLLITLVSFFVLAKIAKFVLKALFGTMIHRAQQKQQQQRTSKKPVDGNVNIDYPSKKGRNPSKNFHVGDYVDFEEVKK